jgi:adenylate cyclase
LSLGAASAPAVLPRRVLEQLAASRQRTQLLTGWVQLGILTLFAVLYTLAPKPISAGAPFEPVPWVLGIYAVFTLGRLSFAYRRELPPWVLMLSAILDVLILMVAIWSFHLQYQQPAAFYLKAPTLLYVFIFIALRALSYRPSYVLVSGGAAAIGWLVLATYAIVEPGGMERVTRDYVAYMTDARILVGAEIDKVISIVVVTLVLAYAVSRSRKLLKARSPSRLRPRRSHAFSRRTSRSPCAAQTPCPVSEMPWSGRPPRCSSTCAGSPGLRLR